MPAVQSAQKFDIQGFIKESASKLSHQQRQWLETSGSLNELQLTQNDSSKINMKARFWKDSAGVMQIAAYYYGLLANLDNSEKNLTFAAQFYLDCLRNEEKQDMLEWESAEAIALFEKAISLNPQNEDLKIGLASCYVFGKGRAGNPQETMKGVLQLLEVVRRDSNNMKAQLVLGIGGYVSGQYDKAIARLEKVIAHEPGNLEAVAFLADTYATKGDNENAIKWYNVSKRMVNDEHYSAEVDRRIKELQRK